MSEEELEQEWIAGGAHESFVSWLCCNFKAQHERGDTYRRRALALRKQAQQRLLANRMIQSWGWRGWNLNEEAHQQIIALRAERDALQASLTALKRELSEAYNSDDGSYRP